MTTKSQRLLAVVVAVALIGVGCIWWLGRRATPPAAPLSPAAWAAQVQQLKHTPFQDLDVASETPSKTVVKYRFFKPPLDLLAIPNEPRDWEKPRSTLSCGLLTRSIVTLILHMTSIPKVFPKETIISIRHCVSFRNSPMTNRDFSITFVLASLTCDFWAKSFAIPSICLCSLSNLPIMYMVAVE